MTEQTPPLPVLTERPPYFIAGLVALGALLLYVATLAPTTQFWDSSEYMAAAHALGIPHPPGNPLFIILGHAWGLLALTATNHLMGVLVAPAVLVYVLATDPRALRRPRFLVAAALVAAVGTSVYLFLPIRAHFDPYLNEGAPTTWRALKAVLTREQFGKPSVFDNPDRKSTRLNSRHSQNSYAGFCLKQKKATAPASARHAERTDGLG